MDDSFEVRSAVQIALRQLQEARLRHGYLLAERRALLARARACEAQSRTLLSRQWQPPAQD